MKKKQFKKKKTVQIQRDIKNHIKTVLTPNIFKEIEKIVYDESTDQKFIEMDNDDIKNYILKTYL